MLFRLPLLACGCLATLHAAPGIIPQTNPGFEDALAGWSIPAADRGMSHAVPEAAFAGKLGLRVTDSDTAAGSNLASARLPVKPGRFYQVTFQARLVQGSGVGVYLRFFDALKKLIQPQDQFVAALGRNPRWQRHQLVAEAPAAAVEMELWVHSYNQSTATADFDDFTLAEVPAPKPRAAAGLPNRPMAWVEDSHRLPSFSQAHPEAAFAPEKIIQADGSVFRTPVEDWDGARARVARDPEWAAWVKSRRDRLDAWINRHHDQPGWIAGWWHDFVSPKDGSFLVWTDDVPGRDVDHLTSRTGDRVEITPAIFAAWVGQFRQKNAEHMVEAARQYRLSGDERLAGWAAGQLDFYANHYDGWPVTHAKGNYARLGCQSLDDAVLLSRLVETARLLFDWSGPARRQAWFDHLFRPEVELLDRSFQVIHNIAVWHRSAQAQVALLYGDTAMWKRVVDGKFGLRAQLRRGVTDDYFWYEQSMGYNDYVVMAIHPLLLMAGLRGRGEDLRHEAAVVENLMLAPLALRFPDGTLPNPADSGNSQHAPSRWLGLTYRELPTPLGLASASSVRSWDTLVDPPTPSTSPAVMPEVKSVKLESTHFALLKHDDWQVFFHYGQLSRSHSQAEALNWSASFRGIMISQDPGTVGYGSALASGYYRRGLNHNVPLLGGEGEVPWHPGELTRFDAIRAVMSASQPDYRPDASASRTLKIVNNQLIDETTLTRKAGAAGLPVGLSLHLQGHVKLPPSFHPATDFTTGRPAPFACWQDVQSATFENLAEFDVRFAGGTLLHVRFETPGPFIVYQGSSPGYPPERRAGFYLESLTPGAPSTTFRTTISPAPF